jgi:hypothetical protein
VLGSESRLFSLRLVQNPNLYVLTPDGVVIKTPPGAAHGLIAASSDSCTTAAPKLTGYDGRKAKRKKIIIRTIFNAATSRNKGSACRSEQFTRD